MQRESGVARFALGEVAEPARPPRGTARRCARAAAHVAALDGGEHQAGERLAALAVRYVEVALDERAPVGETPTRRRDAWLRDPSSRSSVTAPTAQLAPKSASSSRRATSANSARTFARGPRARDSALVHRACTLAA
jgi:hypothetical protein